MPRKKTQQYNEDKIKTLSSLEHIRLRAGMYIGRLGDGSNPEDGIYILLKEIIDNSIDEFIMGHGKKIEITIDDTLKVQVRDYGRGIPPGKLVDCVSVINTGAKYNDDVFQFSVGLNGVGTKAVNALSRHFLVRSYRKGRYAEAVFEQGKLLGEKKGGASQEEDGTYVEFIPDESMFKKAAFRREFLEQRIANYAYLNRGLKLYLNKKKFESQKGLTELLENEIGRENTVYEIAGFRHPRLEGAFTHTGAYGETYFSFVNGQHTADGGTHQSAFREGILKGVNEFFKKNYNSVDVREGFSGAVAVKIKDPIFESQTKNKLGNTDVRAWIVALVKDSVADCLHKNPESAEILEKKILDNEKLRKELNAVKKEARIAAKKISINIPSLKDCKYHRTDGSKGAESMIFITEGQSATGSMVSCRDVYTQAIFSLRGKPWNAYGKGKADIYRNEELYNLMVVLGIEHDPENLRYEKIILATDADNDGFHIRNLLLTFFLNYFEELVLRGHVYILETPLFRVRNKKVTHYCYSEQERNGILEKGSSWEVTRFKGLGEISPSEFGQFIDKNMKCVPISATVKDVPKVLSFYMGKNTPERRKYIMEHLI